MCDLSAARYDDAWGHLRRIFAHGDPAYHHGHRGWVVADLAEAAARSGHQDEARGFLAEVRQAAGDRPAPMLRAALHYARALLAGDDEADALFRSALGSGSPDGACGLDASGPGTELARFPFYWMRAQLAYGTWLRRQRRIAESRPPLRAAADAFDALGNNPRLSSTAIQTVGAKGYDGFAIGIVGE